MLTKASPADAMALLRRRDGLLDGQDEVPQRPDNLFMHSEPIFAPLAGAPTGCVLCETAGGHLVWQDADWRVIRAEEPDFPAFYRVVLRRHVADFSALALQDQARCMALVTAVERVLIERLRPIKVNLAALGNAVPHLHWHVIARFDWDSHFPQPVWGARLRELAGPATDRLPMTLEALDAAVSEALA